MTTMIAVYDKNGCIGRCDARCYDAKEPDCHCICGGKNHGAGKKQAMENTQELAEQWIEAYGQQHPEANRYTIPARKTLQPENTTQLTLPFQEEC